MQKINRLYQLFLFVRSCLFSVFLFITMVPYSFLCLAALIFPLRVRYLMVVGWTYLMVKSLRFFCGIDYHVEGLENIPKDHPGVILSKHQSTWETLFLPTLFPNVAIIVKKELMWLPFFGWGLFTVEPIAINRSDRASAIEQIFNKGKKALDQGRWILVFPEGTRVSPGVVGTYRQGGARLAVHAGYPVIPVAHNAGRYWPKRKFIKKPGTIHIAIGPLIETKGRTPDAVITDAKNWIESTLLRIDQNHSV